MSLSVEVALISYKSYCRFGANLYELIQLPLSYAHSLRAYECIDWELFWRHFCRLPDYSTPFASMRAAQMRRVREGTLKDGRERGADDTRLDATAHSNRELGRDAFRQLINSCWAKLAPHFMSSTKRVPQIYILGWNSGIKSKRELS